MSANDQNTAMPTQSSSRPSSARSVASAAVSQESPSNPVLQSSSHVVSRSTSPHSFTTTATAGRRSEYVHNRQPSSSSVSTASSRRASAMLSPPDSGTYPQRFPRPVDSQTFADLHQELEAEQEAQVNRLLNLIRQQNLNASGEIDLSSNAATIDSSSTTSGRRPRSPRGVSGSGGVRLSRESSYCRNRSISRGSSVYAGGGAGGDTPSEAGSSVAVVWAGSSQLPSDGAFHMVEFQMLKRENEILRRQIKDLERQVQDLGGSAASSEAPPPLTASAPVPTNTLPVA